MASDKIIELNSDNFDQETQGEPILVDFWAERSITVGKIISSRRRL